MPLRDKFLTLSGSITTTTTAGPQTFSAAAASTVSTTGPYSPFDLGQLVSSQYGQSPYQSTGLLSSFSNLGQSVKKFFFLAYLTAYASGGTAASGLTVKLQAALTSSATYKILVQTDSILYPKLTTAASWWLPMIKVPIPEGIYANRFIKGALTSVGAVKHAKFVIELTEY